MHLPPWLCSLCEGDPGQVRGSQIRSQHNEVNDEPHYELSDSKHLCCKSFVWSRPAVLLRQQGYPGPDWRLHGGQHSGPSARLGLASVRQTPPRSRTVPLAVRRPQLLLLLPVVRQLPVLLQTPTLQRLQPLQTPQHRSGSAAVLVSAISWPFPFISSCVFPAVVFGDPHFVTFDGVSYSFNGRGEYDLVKSQKDLTIQGRTEPMSGQRAS